MRNFLGMFPVFIFSFIVGCNVDVGKAAGAYEDLTDGELYDPTTDEEEESTRRGPWTLMVSAHIYDEAGELVYDEDCEREVTLYEYFPSSGEEMFVVEEEGGHGPSISCDWYSIVRINGPTFRISSEGRSANIGAQIYDATGEDAGNTSGFVSGDVINDPADLTIDPDDDNFYVSFVNDDMRYVGYDGEVYELDFEAWTVPTIE